MRRFEWAPVRGLLSLMIVLGIVISALAFPPPPGKGGGGGGEEPPSEPAPVTFGLFVFSMPEDYVGGTVSIEEMNQEGEAIGYYPVGGGAEQPFYFDVNSASSVVTNLNDIEIDPNYPVPAGWHISAATGINNLGDISLSLALDSDPADVLRGGILELRPDPLDPTLKPRIHLIPDAAWTHTYARRINDACEVLGRGDNVTSYVYRPGLHGATADTQVSILPFSADAWNVQMNNPTVNHGTQLVYSDSGIVWQYTLGDANPVFLTSEVNLSSRGLSDSSAFCGSRNIRKNKTIGAIYAGVVIDVPDLNVAEALNADGDAVGNSPAFILVHPTHGALNLDELTVGASSADQQLWDSGDKLFNRITERDVVGTDAIVADFPVVYGSLRRYDTELSFHYEAYALFPLPPN